MSAAPSRAAADQLSSWPVAPSPVAPEPQNAGRTANASIIDAARLQQRGDASTETSQADRPHSGGTVIKQRPENTGSLKLAIIRIDGGTQMRADLNEDVVAEYAQIVRDGGDFPPIVVYFDGSKYWLADGFHRFHAYRAALAEEIPADVRTGTKRDAILYSVGANASHGLRRSNADKRKAVETLLADKEWSAWSDRELARRAGVSDRFVNGLRQGQSSANGSQMPSARTVERNGTTYQQDTANIGKAKPADQTEAPPAAGAEIQPDKRAQQAENDRWHEEQRAAVPEHIRQAEALRDAAIAKRREAADAADDDGLTDEQRIAELREHIKVVEAENELLKAENVKFDAMRVQWEQGGFEKVVAGKDEELRVKHEQFLEENASKIAWMKKAKWGLKELKAAGWKPDVKIVDPKTGEFRDA